MSHLRRERKHFRPYRDHRTETLSPDFHRITNVCVVPECNRPVAWVSTLKKGQSRTHCYMHKKRLDRHGSVEDPSAVRDNTQSYINTAKLKNRYGTRYMDRLIKLANSMGHKAMRQCLEDEEANSEKLAAWKLAMDKISDTYQWTDGGNAPEKHYKEDLE